MASESSKAPEKRAPERRPQGTALRVEWLLVALIALATGLFSQCDFGLILEERASDRALVFKSRLAPCPPAAPITLVELDDLSLEQYGRWPWPRERIGELIAGLSRLEARSLFLDIEFPEESGPSDDQLADAIARARARGVETYGVAYAGGEIGDLTLDEAALTEAIASSCDGDVSGKSDLHRLICHLRLHPMDSVLGALAAIPGLDGLTLPPEPGPDLPVSRQLIHSATLSAVTQSPAAPTATLTHEVMAVLGLGDRPELVDFTASYLPRLVDFLKARGRRLDVLREKMDRIRREIVAAEVARHDRAGDSVPTSAVASEVLDALTLGQTWEPVVRQMVSRHRALGLVRDRDATTLSGREPGEKLRVVPPAHPIASAYTGIGSSAAPRDADGVLRRMTLFFPIAGGATSGQLALPQAVLPMLAPILSLDLTKAAVNADGAMVIPRQEGGGPDLVVPCDEAMAVRINWRGRWREGDFPHVSASAILSYSRTREEREAQFAGFRSRGKAEHPVLVQILEQLRSSKGPDGKVPLSAFIPPGLDEGWDARPAATRAGWIEQVTARLREIETQVQKGAARSLSSIEKYLQKLIAEKGASGPIDKVRRERNELADTYDRLFVSFPLVEQNLKQKVSERLCMVGLTATGTTDICATPLQEHYPGMGVHASFANTLVSGEHLWRLDWMAPGLCLGFAILLMVVLPRVTIGGGVLVTLLLALAHFAVSVAAVCRMNFLVPVVAPVLAIFVTFMAITVHRYFGEEREKRHIRRTFEDFMDTKMVDRLLDDRSLWTEIGGTTRNITAMFSDLQGFTTVSEALGVDQLSDLLTAYLDAMTEVIIRHDGIREKYIGDAIASFFGAPLPYTDHPAKACRAALEQRDVLVELRKKWTRDGVVWYKTMSDLGLELSTRIGVNSGPAKVGNFGAKGMRYYMMMGDTVTLSSRLEGANKRYGTSILVSGSTFAEARGAIEAREVDVIRVKGRAEPVSIHELFCVKGGMTAAQAELSERFAAALAKYRARAWLEARELFEAILAGHPEDGPTREYVRRLKDLSWVETLPPDWDGTYTMTEK